MSDKSIDLRPEDLQVTVLRTGINQPCEITIRHGPSGAEATAIDVSQLRAREKAITALRDALSREEKN